MDVFIAASTGEKEHLLHNFAHLLGGHFRVDRIQNLEDPTVAEFDHMLRTNMSVYDAYVKISGKGQVMSPLFGERGSGLWQYYSQSRCLQMVKRKEERRSSVGLGKYTHVAVGRTDLFWLARHPLIAPKAGCLIPYDNFGHL